MHADKKFRDCCWDIDQRGSVGETVLHLCLLNATAIHADLAKRLIQAFPKMMNDIYLADEYFGSIIEGRFKNPMIRNFIPQSEFGPNVKDVRARHKAISNFLLARTLFSHKFAGYQDVIVRFL